MLFQKIDDFCSVVLKKPTERVLYIIEHISFYYKEFYITKQDKNGNPRKNKDKYRRQFGLYWTRTIDAPHRELKYIQSKINKYLIENIKMPEYAYGGVKGRDNIINALRHKGIKYVFQTDIKDFFPFITNKMVYNMLVLNGFSPDVASVITKLVTYKGHLPQGSPASTTIANLVFVPVGIKLQQFAEDNKLRFTTFVDDMTISSQTDFKHIVPDILEIITTGGFKISQQKTTYKSGIKEITGVRLPNNTLTTTKQFKYKYSDIESLPDNRRRGVENYKQRIQRISENSKKFRKTH